MPTSTSPKPKSKPTESDFEAWFRAKHGRKSLCHALIDDIRERQAFFDRANGKVKSPPLLSA